MFLRSTLFRADFLSQSPDDPSLGRSTPDIQVASSLGRPGLTYSELLMLHTVIAVENLTLTLYGRPKQVSIKGDSFHLPQKKHRLVKKVPKSPQKYVSNFRPGLGFIPPFFQGKLNKTFP